MAKDTRYVRGAEKLSQRIATISAALSLPPMMEELSALLLRRTLKRFDLEVDPDGRPWAPLAGSTLERRKRKGGKSGAKKLVQTGQMRASIKKIRGGIDSIFTNTGAGFRIGIDDPTVIPRARVHNRGFGSTPQRRFLGIAATDVKSVDSFLRRRALTLDSL